MNFSLKIYKIFYSTNPTNNTKKTTTLMPTNFWKNKQIGLMMMKSSSKKKARIYISLLRFGIRDGNKPK